MDDKEKKEAICPLIGAECMKSGCSLWMDGITYKNFGNGKTQQGACALMATPILIASAQATQAAALQRFGGNMPDLGQIHRTRQ